ncbi:hypothetical protein JCM3774_003261 [Rhodotorula dairenensis]
MQCAACARTEPQRNGAWYCHSCISSRLREYTVKRQQLRNQLTLVTNNATALLTGSTNSDRLGVEQERLLKAEKWTLASRAYAAREQTIGTKAHNHAEATQLEQRRQKLAARRANLATAQSLLANLASPVPSASSLSLPQSVSALDARSASLDLASDALGLETAQTRAILARELVAVYALRRIVVELPLPDPFLTAPLAASTSATPSPFLDPSSTVATLRTRPLPAPIAPTYLLASLPLPRLSHLVSASLSQAHVEAVLSHLVHLVRLLALYEGVLLPFTPLPSCFGPGRAGVRVAVGWGTADVGSSTTTSRRDERPSGSEDRGTPTRADRAPVPTLAISDGDCFPLCFPSSSRSNHHRRRTRQQHPGRDDAPLEGEAAATTTTDEGSDPGPPPATPTGRAGARRRRRWSRTKGILLGAVAIAYDLAYIAWQREQQQQQQRALARPTSLPKSASAPPAHHADAGANAGSSSTDWCAPELLDDLGELLMRAAGVAAPSDSSALKPLKHSSPNESTTPPLTANFPLSYPAAAAHFLARVFPQRSAAAGSNRPAPPPPPSNSDSLGDSGIVVGFENDVDDDEDDDDDDLLVAADDDEWDLVSV